MIECWDCLVGHRAEREVRTERDEDEDDDDVGDGADVNTRISSSRWECMHEPEVVHVVAISPASNAPR